MTKRIGRPSVWDQHADDMAQMYEDEQKSRGEIARHYNTSVQTVTRVLTRHGIVFEDRKRNPNEGRTQEEQARINAKVSVALMGKKRGPYKPVEKRTCEECKTEFEYHVGRTGERFCSRDCRTKFLVRQNKEGAKAEYEADPRRCPCGEAIPYEYRHTRQFCSPKCRSELQTKRQKDPMNYVTFNCLRCDKEVTRLKNYGNGHSKYCSNECAQRHTKVKKHYGVTDLEIVFDSSYETLFWSLCRILKIPVERFDREQCIQLSNGHYYGPDFYLPRQDLYVETKGYEDDDDRARYRAWERDHKLVVLTTAELHNLRLSMTVKEFEGHLERLSQITTEMDEYTRTEGAPAGCYITQDGHVAPLPHYSYCKTCGRLYKIHEAGASPVFCSKTCYRLL